MIGQLARILGPQHRGAYLRYLATLVAHAVAQGTAYLLLVPILRALLDGDSGEAGRWAIALGVVTIAVWVLSYRQQRQGFALGLVLAGTLRHQLGDRLAALPLGWFRGDRVGQVGQLVGKGTSDVMSIPAHLLESLTTSIVTPLTVAVGLLAIDWRLGAVALAMVPMLLVVMRWASGHMQRVEHAAAAADADAGGRIVEYALLQPVLRGAGQVEHGAALLDEALRRRHRAARREVTGVLPGLGASAMMVQLAFTILIAVGVALALGGHAEPAALVALLALVTRFTEPLATAAEYGGAIRAARNSLDRIEAVLDEPVLPEPEVSLVPADSSIELEGVGFAYETGRRVLDGLSLRAEAGSVTALVGPSGAGKSTIVRLIARFADVERGQVRIGGVDVRELRAEELAGRLALVLQDVYLFEGTIRENLRMGRPDASDEEVERAAAQARVDDVVARLPHGWETQVGEGGAALSGGERQRVAIARALLKDAPIVLLDEVTAALDAENEAAVVDALRSLARGRTVVVVAHRLSTIAGADRVVVVDGGRAVEAGRHDELLSAGGRYAALWRERTAARGWRIASAAEADGPSDSSRWPTLPRADAASPSPPSASSTPRSS